MSALQSFWTLKALVGPVCRRIVRTLVEAFVGESVLVYGYRNARPKINVSQKGRNKMVKESLLHDQSLSCQEHSPLHDNDGQ